MLAVETNSKNHLVETIAPKKLFQQLKWRERMHRCEYNRTGNK